MVYIRKNIIKLLLLIFVTYTVMDASGRLQSGLHSTHIRSLGNFDQCLSIENPSQKFVGKYCLLKLDFGTNILEPVFDQLMAEYFHFYIKELETVEPQYLV